MIVTIQQYVNLTEWNISLRDDKDRVMIDNLKPFETKQVRDYEKEYTMMADRCNECGSMDWRVGVVIDEHFVNIEITYRDLSQTPRIIFKTGTSEKGNTILLIEGIAYNHKVDSYLMEETLGWLFRRNRTWDKRPTFPIAGESEEGFYELHPPLPDVLHLRRMPFF